MADVKKISVVGGAGFVGTNLCQLLTDQNIPFEIIDLKPSRRFPQFSKTGDVRDLDTMRDTITGDVVVNLAAVHRDDVRDKSEYYKTNVAGTENLIKICDEKDIRKILFTSTVAVYGFAPPETNENGDINPFNEYGRTKFQAEEALRSWFTDEKTLIIVRPTVIFGEGNRGNVFNLLNQIASGKFVMVGNGRNRKSMAYIGNIVTFLLDQVSDAEGYQLYNYVDKPDFDMNTLVSLVRKTLSDKSGTGVRLPYSIGLGLGYIAEGLSKLTGKSLPISSIRVKKFCATTSFGSTLGEFKAPFSLEEGLRRTLEAEFLDPDPDREMFFTE